MSPEILALAIPVVAGGAMLAQLSGPLACSWPAQGRAMLRRLNAVKTWRRPGAVRRTGGGVMLAAVLVGGGWAAYAAAPSQPLSVASAPARPPATLAVLTDASPRSARAERVAILAAADASDPKALATQPPAASLPAAASNMAYLIRADDSNYAQVRADILNRLPPAVRAALPANPVMPGPHSVYAPAGVSAEGIIAQAFADPRGTWEASAPDARGGRTITRTSASVALSPPLSYAFPASGTVVTFYRVPSPGAAAPAAPTP